MTISDLSPENQKKACIALKLVQQTVTGAREGYAPIYGREHKALTAAISELRHIFVGNRQISKTLGEIDDSLNDGLLARPQNKRGIEKALINTENIMLRLGMGPPDWKIPAMPTQQA
jgi:hypothetical protein